MTAPSRQRGHRAGRRVRRRPSGRRRGARRIARRPVQRPRRVRERPDRAASPGWPIRTTSTANNAWRPASGTSTAFAGRCWPPCSAAFATRRAAIGRRRCCSSPIACSASPSSSRAGSRSGSSSGRWTAETERTWQLLRRAAREAGDWITVDSLAHPYGKGIARRALPLGRARAARLQPVALGAAARRLDDRHDDRMASGGAAAIPSRGRRPAAARPADRRRRAGRPEGAVLGLPLADDGRSRRPPTAALEPRPSARPRPATATAPGSSAIRCPSSTRPIADELRTASPASASARRAGHLRGGAETAARFGDLPDPRPSRAAAVTSDACAAT